MSTSAIQGKSSLRPGSLGTELQQSRPDALVVDGNNYTIYKVAHCQGQVLSNNQAF